MRRLFAIISALLLALLISGGILMIQGKDLNTLFSWRNSEPRLPSLPSRPSDEERVEETSLSYADRLKKGDDYFERGFLTLAVNEYVKAANLEPTQSEPYLKLLRAHLELRNYDKALSNAKLVLERDPNNNEARFATVLAYIKSSDFDAAKNLLETYPILPDAPDGKVLYYKGLLTASFGNHELARKHLKEALSVSDNPELSGKINFMLEAYSEFDLSQGGEGVYLKELLARGMNKAEEYEMAIHTLKEVLKQRPDLRDAWILLGFAYLNLEKYQFAQTAFDKANSLDSTWPVTQYFLGITHKELGNFDKAIVYFNAALTHRFEPAILIQGHLADLYFETKNYQKAASAYEAVLEIDQKNVDAYVRPVWIYLDYIKDPAKALKIAQSAALAFPQSAMSYNLLGWSYTGLKDEKKAEENLKRALELDPSLAAAHYNLATLKETQEAFKEALAGYQRAYELDSRGSIGNLAASRYNELLKKTLNSEE